jgi:hypothetical protein
MAYNFYANSKMTDQQINATQEGYEQAIQNRINDNINQFRNEKFNYELALNQEEQAQESLKEQTKIAGFGELIQSGIELPAGINSIKNTYQKVKQVYNNLGKTAENAKSLVDNVSQKLSDAPSSISDAVSQLKSVAQQKVSDVTGIEPSDLPFKPSLEPSAVSSTKTGTATESNIMNADESRAFLNDRIDNFYGEGSEVENVVQKASIASKSDAEVIRAANRGQYIPEGQPITMDNFNKYKPADAPEWLSQKGGSPPVETEQGGGVVSSGEQVQTASGLNPKTSLPNESIASTKEQVSYNVAQGGEAEASTAGTEIGSGVSTAVDETAPIIKPVVKETEKSAGGLFGDLFGDSIFGDIFGGISDILDPVAGLAAAGLGIAGAVEGGKAAAGEDAPTLPPPPPPPKMVQSIVPQADITATAQPGV